MNSRNDGWDSRGSEGWRSFRCCRPLLVKDLSTPDDKDAIGSPGGLEGDVRVPLPAMVDVIVSEIAGEDIRGG